MATNDIAGLTLALGDLADAERERNRRLLLIFAAIVLLGATFVVLTYQIRSQSRSNGEVIERVDQRFDGVDGRIDGLACFAARLAGESPPIGVSCPTP